MRNSEREAWAKHLEEKREYPTLSEPQTLRIAGSTPNKANLYEVRLDPSLWRELRDIVGHWVKRHPRRPCWWVGAGERVKNYEELLAWKIKEAIRGGFGRREVELTIGLHGQKIDVDGVKAILDAIEKSGIIGNDRQVTRLVVEKFPAEAPSLELTIAPRASKGCAPVE